MNEAPLWWTIILLSVAAVAVIAWIVYEITQFPKPVIICLRCGVTDDDGTGNCVRCGAPVDLVDQNGGVK